MLDRLILVIVDFEPLMRVAFRRSIVSCISGRPCRTRRSTCSAKTLKRSSPSWQASRCRYSGTGGITAR